MTKELELEVYDIVKIVEGNGSICLESINEIHNDENGKLAFTDNFVIDLKNAEVNCVSNGDPYQLEMVWRLDKNRNYTMIYPIQRLESIDNGNPSKVLEELNEIIEYITEDKKVKYKATILFDCEIIKDTLLKAQKLEKENADGVSGRSFSKEITYLKQSIEQCNDKPIYYISRSFGNKYIVPQTLFEKQEQELKKYKNAWEVVKEKCLYNDNLNYVAVCINYDMYKEKMSQKHDTKVVKIDWNDIFVLDCLKLLTQQEFDLLKEMLE